jgi:hypothetical protein
MPRTSKGLRRYTNSSPPARVTVLSLELRHLRSGCLISQLGGADVTQLLLSPAAASVVLTAAEGLYYSRLPPIQFRIVFSGNR